MYPAAAEAGIVRIHAQMIRAPTSQFTFLHPFESPTPRIAEVMTWVVLIGIPIADAVRITPAEEVSAQKPCTGCSLTKSLPTVLMIRHPPIAVPRAIEAAQARMTHTGMWKVSIDPKIGPQAQRLLQGPVRRVEPIQVGVARGEEQVMVRKEGA